MLTFQTIDRSKTITDPQGIGYPTLQATEHVGEKPRFQATLVPLGDEGEGEGEGWGVATTYFHPSGQYEIALQWEIERGADPAMALAHAMQRAEAVWGIHRMDERDEVMGITYED